MTLKEAFKDYAGEKSHVGMDCCVICGEPIQILLDRKLRKILPRKIVTSPVPCDKCKKKYLTKGILMINPKSGDLIVIREEAFKRIFNTPVPEKRIAFTEQKVIDFLNKEHERAKDIAKKKGVGS